MPEQIRQTVSNVKNYVEPRWANTRGARDLMGVTAVKSAVATTFDKAIEVPTIHRTNAREIGGKVAWKKDDVNPIGVIGEFASDKFLIKPLVATIPAHPEAHKPGRGTEFISLMLPVLEPLLSQAELWSPKSTWIKPIAFTANTVAKGIGKIPKLRTATKLLASDAAQGYINDTNVNSIRNIAKGMGGVIREFNPYLDPAEVAAQRIKPMAYADMPLAA